MPGKIERVVKEFALVGESPSWDEQAQVLYWVDILTARIFIFNPANNQQRTIDLKTRGICQTVGCVAPREKGGLILGMDRKFAVLDLESEAVTVLGEVETDLPYNRFNDGKCDPAGRFLAGTMDTRASRKAVGSLYCLHPDHTITTLIEGGLLISNGLAWSPDYRTFYFADSGSRDVTAYDYDLEHGTIANPQVCFTIPEDGSVCDGMTTSSDGNIWLAQWDGACVTRWDPSNGKCIEKIDIPALRPASCVFGGPQRSDLYISSAAEDLTEAQRQQYPDSGSLFRLHTEVIGLPSFTFAG